MNKHIKTKNAIYVLLISLFFIELFRTAWIGDDAAITLRTVLNFIHGYGPTFNLGERVQAYIHPLWFLIISGFSALFYNVFYVVFTLSITILLLAFWVLITLVASNHYAAILSSVILIRFKAYVDFSTSGLENLLTHLLILAVALTALSMANYVTKIRQSTYSLGHFRVSLEY